MTEQEIEEWKKKIDKMGQFEMARKWRFAPADTPLFDTTLPLAKYFNERFQKLGGMTPKISKMLGWRR